MRMPVIAIVGRPNVGKSSLLNALTRKRVSIVQDQPGVTRDRVSVPFQVNGKWVELVDTGGYGFNDETGLTDHIAHQIDLAWARADLVVFVVDAHAGLVQQDQLIAKLLRERSANIVIVANKTDSKNYEQALGDFARLGLGTPLGVSATTGFQLDKLVDLIASKVDLSSAPTELPEPEMLVAIVGKRNAGKSTLVNSISRIFEGDPDRVIVSEVPGTTRDSIDVRFEKDGKTLVVIDTAGVRKKRHMVNDDIEFYSFHRAERSIRRADVVIHLLDALETVSEPDKKLASYVDEQAKPCVIVFNKWDLATAAMRERLKPGEKLDEPALQAKFVEYVREELKGQRHAPVMFITAKDGRKVQAVLDKARNILKQAQLRLSTSKLNDAMRAVLAEQTPSPVGKRRPKVYYATQTEVCPPTIVMFVNKAEWFDSNYQRFVLNRFRELLPFKEVPVRLVVREVAPKQADADPSTFTARPGGKPKPGGKAGRGKTPVRESAARRGKPVAGRKQTRKSN